jgi:hypothetical protein
LNALLPRRFGLGTQVLDEAVEYNVAKDRECFMRFINVTEYGRLNKAGADYLTETHNIVQVARITLGKWRHDALSRARSARGEAYEAPKCYSLRRFQPSLGWHFRVP